MSPSMSRTPMFVPTFNCQASIALSRPRPDPARNSGHSNEVIGTSGRQPNGVPARSEGSRAQARHNEEFVTTRQAKTLAAVPGGAVESEVPARRAFA
jgi:hypothetical protein